MSSSRSLVLRSRRDDRYRLQAGPEDLGGARVLDLGTFDGFYAFLAERRGATRVVALDNEQHVDWLASAARRFVTSRPGRGAAADIVLD